jgi:para-nitrobenzyl esterase
MSKNLHEPSPPIDTLVQTTAGIVRGMRTDDLLIYRGVPYGSVAARRRFQPPELPAKWPGVKDAFEFGPRAPQLARSGPPGMEAFLLGSEPMSEDCLTLNVWTPSLDDRKRAVMVWLHPGGFSAGSASAPSTHGANLARRRDVVVVSVNHRLNIFGYLYLAELGGSAYPDSGNAGQYDQLMALRWVRDNIAAFGGDPNNVTLFGESGGGCKIAALMTMHEATGLFHKAIIQSGPMMKGVDPERATDAARLILETVGLTPNEVDGLQSVSTMAMLDAYGKALTAGHFRTFSPVTDGRGLPREPFFPDAPDQADNIPLMIGFTATEATFLLADPAHFSASWDQVAKLLVPHLQGTDASSVLAACRATRPHAGPSELFFAITSQIMVQRNSVLIADRKAQQSAPVFMYELGWRTPVDGGRWGSPHTLEIPLVFDNVESARALLGEGTAPQTLADQMSSAWITFAKTGNPNAQGAPMPKWPCYETVSRATLVFDQISAIKSYPTADLAGALAEVPLWHCTG